MVFKYVLTGRSNIDGSVKKIIHVIVSLCDKIREVLLRIQF